MTLDYQLHRLGWKAFQQLCGTILRESMGQTFQVFSDVNDAGRDGAFQGVWRPRKGEIMRGRFTVQCKHSARGERALTRADIAEELSKARSLGVAGLAENYLLLTNMSVSGALAQQIEANLQSLPGIKHAKVFGRDWIESQIHENKHIRMHVPRIYGLGDLTQILNDRAHAQAQAILHDLGEDFSRFVVTDAHRKSVKAITDKGFVFLLGEPCCGKSTIAAALALAAADKWGCELVRVTEPRDFSQNWNPKNSDQFFWVDDVFGSTQYERELALSWNRIFPALEAAVRKGAKVVFTSRDYVYSAAMADLKDLSFPELRDSQVVIHVEELTIPEKEQILYNHIKLGTQPTDAKAKLRDFLSDVAAHDRFLPETARRLSQPLFTKGLSFNKAALLDFVGNMKQFLLDTLRTIGASNAAATALVFMRRGRLRADLSLTANEKDALLRLGASVSDVRRSLKDLEPTLFVRTVDKDEEVWRFKHPSIRDAYGILIADDPALSDIFLENAPTRSLLREITCGAPAIEGVKVKVAPAKYPLVIGRLKELRVSDSAELEVIITFLRNRCGKRFIAEYLAAEPALLEHLEYWSWMLYDSNVRLAAKLHGYGLLPEDDRQRLAEEISDLTIRFGDAACYREPEIGAVLKEPEQRALRKRVMQKLFGALRSQITEARDRCIKGQREIWSEFVEPKANIASFAKEFQNKQFQQRLQKTKHRIFNITMKLSTSRRKRKEDISTDTEEAESSARSIFDDVAE